MTDATRSPAIADPLDTFSTAELRRMTARAYREAARCWQELDRRTPDGRLLPAEARRLMTADTIEADRLYETLRDATARRMEP